MKILLVTRGSQGDVLPYLAVAEELRRRGHEVTLNVPSLFETSVKSYGFRYTDKANILFTYLCRYWISDTGARRIAGATNHTCEIMAA